MIPVDLRRINYEEDPELRVSFEVDEHFLVLYCKAEGLIAKGSRGNHAADYLFGKICQYYFQAPAYCLILDLSGAGYEWGDRLQKSVYFFDQIGRDEHEKAQPVILILSPSNPQGVQSLTQWTHSRTVLLAADKPSAVAMASGLLTQYLGEDDCP